VYSTGEATITFEKLAAPATCLSCPESGTATVDLNSGFFVSGRLLLVFDDADLNQVQLTGPYEPGTTTVVGGAGQPVGVMMSAPELLPYVDTSEPYGTCTVTFEQLDPDGARGTVDCPSVPQGEEGQDIIYSMSATFSALP
jgi:hypothetical protein